MDEFHSFYYGTTCNEPETSDIVLPSGTEMTPTLLKELIDHHQENHVPRFKILKNAYENKYKIFSEEAKPKGKPDNRLSANFAKYITDTMNGFFIGIPIKVTHPNSDRHEIIKSFESRNVQEDLDSELSKHSSIYGVCYELLYQSDDGKAYSTLLKPLSAFKVYDDSVLRRSMYGVHYWYNEQGEVNGTFSDKEGVYSFSEKDGTLNIYDVEPHYFGDVPMIEYKDNDEKQGIYEGVLNLINAYNKALSEKANDVDYFADAYLKILGMVVDEEELNNMRTNRTINADDASAIVEFLQKPDGDATQENLIERLERLIFQLSMVADISDESFGTQSGIALKYKLQAMKNLAKTKERKFTASMKQRYRLLCNYPQIGLQEDDWEKLSFVFTLDYPANIAEEA
ncbi:MAG: phage portal protein, partial [Raoultibacter sp.]